MRSIVFPKLARGTRILKCLKNGDEWHVHVSERITPQGVWKIQTMATSWLCLLILPAAARVVHQWTRQRGGEGWDYARALQADRVSESFSWSQASELHSMFRLSTISEPLQGQCRYQYPLPCELN